MHPPWFLRLQCLPIFVVLLTSWRVKCASGTVLVDPSNEHMCVVSILVPIRGQCERTCLSLSSSCPCPFARAAVCHPRILALFVQLPLHSRPCPWHPWQRHVCLCLFFPKSHAKSVRERPFFWTLMSFPPRSCVSVCDRGDCVPLVVPCGACSSPKFCMRVMPVLPNDGVSTSSLVPLTPRVELRCKPKIGALSWLASPMFVKCYFANAPC